MSEFVKKSVVGYKVVPGGHSDPECSHVILTVKEYDKLVGEINAAKRAVREAEQNAEAQIRKTNSAATAKVQSIEDAAKERVNKAYNELNDMRSAFEYQKGLNENLLRISKERANADRKLKPKKEHTGYAVCSSTEKEIRYKDGRRRLQTAILWETVLQSPYSIDFSEDQARQEMFSDLFSRDAAGHWMIGRIGVTAEYEDGYADLIERREEKEYEPYNVMLERRLRANYRTKYWELIFLHTKPLGIVPPDMRAGQG